MKRGIKLKRCVDCNGLFNKRELNRKGRCYECGIKACLSAARQLHIKEGKFYESWKRGLRKAVKRF